MGHGDHWGTIQADVSDVIETLIPRLVEKGKMIGETIFEHTDEAGTKSSERGWGLSYGDTPVRFLALIASQSKEDPPSNVLYSAYPAAIDGVEVDVEIEKAEEWCNPIEGIVHGSAMGVGVAFFDTLFFKNRHQYQSGQTKRFRLAALAYALRKPEQMSIEVKEGPMIEMERERRLKEDPNFDVSSITSVTLSLEGMCGMFPREVADDFEVRTVAEEVGYFEIEGIGFYRILCAFARPDDQELKVVLYASESVLNGYRPQAGDNIEGIVWLQGYLAD